VPWSRGVDIAAFHPRPHAETEEARQIWARCGRVAIEKNIRVPRSDLPGTKWVVGGGPKLKGIEAPPYADVHFFGSGRHRGTVATVRAD